MKSAPRWWIQFLFAALVVAIAVAAVAVKVVGDGVGLTHPRLLEGKAYAYDGSTLDVLSRKSVPDSLSVGDRLRSPAQLPIAPLRGSSVPGSVDRPPTSTSTTSVDAFASDAQPPSAWAARSGVVRGPTAPLDALSFAAEAGSGATKGADFIAGSDGTVLST